MGVQAQVLPIRVSVDVVVAGANEVRVEVQGVSGLALDSASCHRLFHSVNYNPWFVFRINENRERTYHNVEAMAAGSAAYIVGTGVLISLFLDIFTDFLGI